MSSQKSVRLFLILMALVLALAACRRGQLAAMVQTPSNALAALMKISAFTASLTAASP